MADPNADPAVQLESPQTSGSAPGSIGHPSPPDRVDGWNLIGEPRGFYDEQDCLHPSHCLTSEKLNNRKKDDVVIFDYSLDPDYLKRADRNPPLEGAASSAPFSADDDIFFQLPKDKLIESKQFDQMIGPPKTPRQSVSQGPRLGIM